MILVWLHIKENYTADSSGTLYHGVFPISITCTYSMIGQTGNNLNSIRVWATSQTTWEGFFAGQGLTNRFEIWCIGS